MFEVSGRIIIPFVISMHEMSIVRSSQKCNQSRSCLQEKVWPYWNHSKGNHPKMAASFRVSGSWDILIYPDGHVAIVFRSNISDSWKLKPPSSRVNSRPVWCVEIQSRLHPISNSWIWLEHDRQSTSFANLLYIYIWNIFSVTKHVIMSTKHV